MAVNPYRIVRVITPIPIYIRYWREPVQTRDGLPAQGNEVGDVRAVLDELALYMWDGAQWRRLTNRLFTQLEDTPESYSGQGKKYVRVKETEDGLEFAVPSFLELTDTPSSYTGQGGKFVRVKPTEDGLEFGYPKFTELLDTPSSYLGYAKHLVRVKPTEDGLEFIDWKHTRAPKVIVPDDFDDIQRAIDWLADNYGGGLVFLKAQDYKLETTLELRNGVSLIGIPAVVDTTFKLPKLIPTVSPVITQDSRTGSGSGSVLMWLEFDGQGTIERAIYDCFAWMDIIRCSFTGFVTEAIFTRCAMLRITGCWFDTCKVAIHIASGHCVVEDNDFMDNDVDIVADGSEHVIRGNRSVGAKTDSIQVAGSRNSIYGNIIRDPNASGGDYGGIKVSGSKNIISGNHVYDTRSTSLLTFGIYEVSGADYNIIYGNLIDRYVKEGVHVEGSNTVTGLNLEIPA